MPKKLHFVWIGDESKRPDGCIDSWRRLNPDYEVFVWGNEELVTNEWVNGRHMRDMMDHELCGVADLMRYEILFSEGGIALDADSVCLRPLEDWIVEPGDFTCWNSEHLNGQLLANGVMGAEPQSPYIAAIIQAIHAKATVVDRRAWLTTGPMVISEVWRELQYPLTIWPSHMFLPVFHTGFEYSGTGPVFARQFWGSTHGVAGDGSAAYDVINRAVTVAGER